ncbi:XrtA/PEP-CTERM system-associated ATPase [Sphingosinicella sp. LY1275]|uniref:XrtA/PEP-CTERM system-associated ATPase n=1 Tax=Sphingosinicella sp. LY1275 TaxID=3095379 RepID=UPI002ADEC91D|nr:XrtA/PEP-CTERM system-associated ATPase [Sphingosinicella sp. LY1275]MEA1013571.1 XrtA/PEP-CTERM system-associated ATPase [Sphingosinicella sp. LY1275]
MNDFGLTERPFQLTPDARFYFDSRTHKKAMAYLGYGLAQGEGFIVITGEVGAGKSTLVAHLMATIDRARLNAVNIVSTQVQGDDMLRLVAQKLGITTDGVAKAGLLERVEQHLEEQARSGRRTLLIVDEAQNLGHSALEELRMLSNYQIGGRALLQIFLLGQPEFRDDLAASEGLEQLRQRVIATHHLEPMDEEEIEAYILHRLGIAGWQGRPAFDASAFPAIYRHTGGIPRRVNQIATRLMLFASVEQTATIDADAVDAVAADMGADATVRAEPLLPLRATVSTPAAPVAEPSSPQAVPMAEPPRDFALERRVAALEARLEEQEAAVRRVLTLLVDWVENDEAPSYRHHAA